MYTIQNKILAADYLRLSQDDGDKAESDSIGNQRSLIEDYVKQHKEIKLIKEYVDDGYSGTNFERPAFQKMLEDIKAKKINCIIVKDLSRLGRNYIETGRYLEKIFPLLGVRFIAVNDNYDSADKSNDADQIIVPFKNLINDAYCRDISIKIRSQLDIKRKNGKFVGSFASYGYCKDPNDKNHLIIDEYAAEVVKLIFKMRIEGYSPQTIANKLNELGIAPPMEYKRMCGMNYNSGFRSGANPQWAVTTVNRVLKNELYIGTMVQGKQRKINYKVKECKPVEEENWIRVENTHEAIIDQESFEHVQKIMTLDTRVITKGEKVSLFSGILRCGDCGQNMARRNTKKNDKVYYYYHCITYRNGQGCTSHLISEKRVYDVVLKSIQKQIEILINAEALISKAGEQRYKGTKLKAVNTQIIELEKEVNKYKSILENLYEDFIEEVLTKEEYQELKERFLEKQTEAKKKQHDLKEKQRDIKNKDFSNSEWLNTFKSYKNITSLDRKTIVMLIEKIVVHSKDEIEVFFNYQDDMRQIMEMAEMTVKTDEVV